VFSDGILHYIKVHGHRLTLLILKNVVGLAIVPSEGGPSPLQWAVESIMALDFYSFVFLLDALFFGFQAAYHKCPFTL